MKRIFLTILIIFTFLLSACGKELNSTKEENKRLKTRTETPSRTTPSYSSYGGCGGSRSYGPSC